MNTSPKRFLSALAMLFALLCCFGLNLQAQSTTAYSNTTFNPITLTASGQTSAPLPLAPGPSGRNGAFTAGTISLTGTNLSSVTFGVLGSSDGGATYYPLNISAILTPTTFAATATVTSNGLYQVNLVGITNVEFVTSGTFTATSVSLTLTASPNGTVSRTVLPSFKSYFTGTSSQCIKGDGSFSACGSGSGSSSAGSLYSPQVSDGNGGFRVDPSLTIDSTGVRTLTLNGTSNWNNRLLGYNAQQTLFNGAFSYAPTWNYGQYTLPNSSSSFVTSAFHLQDWLTSAHNPSIYQTIALTTGAYNIGDKSLFAYMYGNFMPGTALAGADEGEVIAGHFKSLPSRTFSLALSSDPTNTTGSTALRWDFSKGKPFCNGSGSNFGSVSCLTAGQEIADLSDPLYTGLHLVGFTGSTISSPTILTTAASDPAMTPTAIVSGTTSLDRAANLSTGDTVSFPITVPNGFIDPATGHAVISSSGEDHDEEVGYTISGLSGTSATITLTAHRLPHYVPSGGAMTISLNSGAVAYWVQDAADNCDNASNGCGKTYYDVVAIVDAHHLMVTAHHTGQRYDGGIYQQASIRSDGSARSVFNVAPSALVVDVNDPTYTPFAIYAPSPSYAHLGTNNVPWATGKIAEEGYWPADQYFFRRDICDTPLADLSIGSECNYMEVRGSVAQVNHYRFTNNPALAPYRGLPNVNYFEPYNNNNGSGAVGYFARGGMVPTYGWLVSTRQGCGGSLDSPANCADHYLWAEGSSINGPAALTPKSIVVSDTGNVVKVGSMPWQFTGPLSGTTMSLSTSVTAPTISSTGGLFGQFGFLGSTDQTKALYFVQDVNGAAYIQNNSYQPVFFLPKTSGSAGYWAFCNSGAVVPGNLPATTTGCNANTASLFVSSQNYVNMTNGNYLFAPTAATFNQTLNGTQVNLSGGLNVTNTANASVNLPNVLLCTQATLCGSFVGRSLSNFNAAYFGMNYGAAGSTTANYATIGFYGGPAPGTWNFFGDGHAVFPGSLTLPSTIFSAGTAPATPVEGQVYNNSATGSLESFLGGQGGVIVRKVFTALASQTVSNPATATSIAPTTGSGSLTLAANYLQPKRTIRIVAGGVYSTGIASQSITIAVKLGATTIATGTFSTGPQTASNLQFNVTAEITLRSCASNSCMGVVVGEGLATINGQTTRASFDLTNGGATFSVPQNTANLLDITAVAATSDASTSLTTTSMQVTEQ